MKIFPFLPVVKDFGLNIWDMRLFLLCILGILACNALAMSIVAPGEESMERHGFIFWFGIALDDAIPPATVSSIPTDGAIAFLRKINGITGYILLGLIFHAIREAFRDQKLKEAKWGLIPTKRDARG